MIDDFMSFPSRMIASSVKCYGFIVPVSIKNRIIVKKVGRNSTWIYDYLSVERIIPWENANKHCFH